MSGALTMTHFDRAEHPLPENEQPASYARLTGADYFQTMGIPLVHGRFFADTDRLTSKQVVIINERFAQKYFPNQDAVGKQMKPLWAVGDQPPQMREIVGVVGNAKHLSLQEDFAPEMYLPIAQIPFPTGTILLRTETSNPATIADTLRAELAHVDSNLPLTAVRMFDEYRASSLAGPRFNALYAVNLRRRGFAPDRGRNLRGDRVFGFAAHRRNWHSHGARRAAIVDLPARRRSGDDAGCASASASDF